jgi:superfamily II DNA/RNA helicase
MALFLKRVFSTKIHSSSNLKRSLRPQVIPPERGDVLKYSYLNTQSRFAGLGDRIHSDLKHSLEVNNYEYMTEIQDKAVKAGLLEGENLILTSETGSGKTLSYLLPIMNQLFHYKDKHAKKAKTSKFKLTKETEDQMFLNAEEIMHKS